MIMLVMFAECFLFEGVRTTVLGIYLILLCLIVLHGDLVEVTFLFL